MTSISNEAAARPSPTRFLVVLLGTLSMFGAIAIDMYLPALPAMEKALAASPAQIQLTLGAFFIGFALSQLVHGPISDRHGRKWPMAAGIVLFILGSIGCALAPDAISLTVFRLIQGLGASAGPVISRAIIRDLYGRDRAARVMSLMMLIFGVAPMLGPIVGGQILLHADWRWIFWTLTLFGALCLLGTLVSLPETLPEQHRQTTRLSGAFRDYWVLLRSRSYMGYMLASGCQYAGMFAYIAGTPYVYIDVFGISPQHFGYLFAVNVLGIVGVAALNGKLVMRHGSDRLLGIGVTMQALGACSLALFGGLGIGGIYGVAVPLFFTVAPLGMVGSNATAGAMQRFPHIAGAAAALGGVFPFGIGTLAAATLGILHTQSAAPMSLIIGALSVLGYGFYLKMVRRPALPTA